jgi:hypothetical protein
MVAGAIGYTYIRVAGLSMNDAVLLLPYAGGIAALLVLGVLLQYSLVPYVTLFESKLSLPQAFARSKQLLRRRGRMFLLLLYVLLAGVLYGIYNAAILLSQLTGFAQWIIFAIGAGTAVMLTNCILVMFYRATDKTVS